MEQKQQTYEAQIKLVGFSSHFFLFDTYFVEHIQCMRACVGLNPILLIFSAKKKKIQRQD